MSIRKILMPIFGRTELDQTLDLGCQVASSLGAFLEARFIRPAAADAAIYDAGFGFASTSLIDQIETEGRKAAEAAQASFNHWQGAHPVRPPVEWVIEEGQVGAVIAKRGCLADLILLQRSGQKAPAIDEAFEGALYGAGRLAMLTDAVLPSNYLDHAMIAWNASTEASRAVALSLPLLQKAGRVSIYTAHEGAAPLVDPTELIRYLALHDVNAQALPAGSSQHAIGEDLVGSAQRDGITLLVMGAYTHGRVRQLLFGGVTQHLLVTPGLPVLMAH